MCGKVRSGLAFDNHSDIFSVVPTGEVDSKITRFPTFSIDAIDLQALLIKLKSGLKFLSLKGVGTVIKKASADSGFVVALR